MLSIIKTAHGHFDMKTGDFHNVMGCMQLPSEDNLVPKVAYLPYALRNAGRSSSNVFTDKLEPQEILDSFEFGEPFYNQKPTDYFLRYFHMISVTENHIVVPLNSLKIDMIPILQGVMVDTQPLAAVSWPTKLPLCNNFGNKLFPKLCEFSRN